MGTISDILFDESSGILRPMVEPIVSYLRGKKQRADILSRFTHEFKKHSPDITYPVDYFKWFLDPKELSQGSGTICSISLHETSRMWFDVNYFSVYEAFCLRYIKRGGKINRIFILEGKLIKPDRMLLFQRTCLRHQLLNFEPRISRVLLVKDQIKSLSVECESFGVINNNLVLYHQFPFNSDPLMVFTRNREFIDKALKTHGSLWRDSQEFNNWLKGYKNMLTKEMIQQVEEECNYIHELVEKST
ncbi:MAG: hypothetical protein Q8M71_08625 [Thermodesulfovibrionales bacterium]|nr:hypothetical protein [Thermodesulfovibrionales bacterium]